MELLGELDARVLQPEVSLLFAEIPIRPKRFEYEASVTEALDEIEVRAYEIFLWFLCVGDVHTDL